MTNNNQSIQERLQIETSFNGFGNIETYKTTIGTFTIQRKEYLSYYGNPVVIITPIGYIESLPPIQYFRRNNDKQHYTTTSYDFTQTMYDFLERMEQQLTKGKRLYYNS